MKEQDQLLWHGANVAEYTRAPLADATDSALSGSKHGRGRRNQAAVAALLLGLLLQGVLPAPAHASEWEVLVERDGIVASRRLIKGRDFPQLRSVGVVRGTPYEILAVLQDVPAYVEWLPDCVDSRVVRAIDQWRSVIYMRTDAPWPVSDREAVVENRVDFTDPPVKVTVSFATITASDVRRKPGTVRMKLATGSYTIEAIDDTRSRVLYQIDADPGGDLPGWLITLQSRRNPFETIAGLRRQIEKTRGRYPAEIARFPSGT